MHGASICNLAACCCWDVACVKSRCLQALLPGAKEGQSSTEVELIHSGIAYPFDIKNVNIARVFETAASSLVHIKNLYSK